MELFGFKISNRILTIAALVLLVIILVSGIYVRTTNLPLLHDSITGKWLSSDIDPFYWLRMAEVILSQGKLLGYDTLRNPALHVPWSTELIPDALVFMYKVANGLGINAPIELISIISPVVFFIFIIIFYFLFVWIITKSKATALISSFLLAFIPLFLYRTMAGVGDHDPFGTFAFFLALAVYALSLIYLNKFDASKKKNIVKVVGLSAIVGFLTAFTMSAQPGMSDFLFMIVPSAFGILWLIKSKTISHEKSKEDLTRFFSFALFFILWVIFSILSFHLNNNGNSYSTGAGYILFSQYGIISLAALGFSIIDLIFIFISTKSSSVKLKKYRVVFSIITTVLFAIIISFVIGKNLIGSASGVLLNLIHPINLRIGVTVAENQQPYLVDLIGQIGSTIFWIFVLGTVLIGFEFAREIKTKKYKILYSVGWVIFVASILLTRYSSTSTFNGNNFISQLVYVLGGLLFVLIAAIVYFKDEINANPLIILISSWAVFMIVSARASQRIYFVIAPFICFAAAHFIVQIFNYARTRKEETAKWVLWLVFGITAILMIYSSYTYVNSCYQQGKTIGPAANSEWQDAMNWTRTQTPVGSVFIHWWDYGWWTQTLGERPTVTDGGHANGYWDHLVGRYFLTETNPAAALSYMKSNNVSYLLFDPSDIGKYPAYSSIGSDDSGKDRLDQISTFVLDDRQTQETSNGTYYVLTGGAPLFDDVNIGGTFFAKENSGIGAFVISTNNSQINGVDAIVVDNQHDQVRVPISCVEFNGNVKFFSNSTISGCLYLIPSASSNQLNFMGTGLWLDNRTFNSMFVQLYLFQGKLLPPEYQSAFTPAHFAQDPAVQFLKSQKNFSLDVANYYGLRGPLEIWKVNYPSNIIPHQEFLSASGAYAAFDNLTFTS